MKTIRGKLVVYFLVFVILFQITAISIFVSSNQLNSTYHDSFQKFLLLNSISQKAEELHTYINTFVIDPKQADVEGYYTIRQELESKQEELTSIFAEENNVEMKNYSNLIDTFIHESELTIGFVLQDDIEQYTRHLDEARNASRYIQASTLELLDVELTSYQSFYNDLQLRNKSFVWFIVFLFLTTIMLAVFFAIWFSKGITKPVDQLSRAAKEVSEGDLLGEPVRIKTNDELKLLGDMFNEMRSNIYGLVEEIKDQSELDRLVKDMELKHLQSQINPHFLFNTLNTLSKMAYLEEARSTSNLIDSVSVLLRHNFGDINKQTTLKAEVEVVNDYFDIQKVRFAERVQFASNVDVTSLDIEVPRLTLQPLVENAFIHGIEQLEEGGSISLTIYQTTTHVMVEVTDDGVGMKQDEIDRVLALINQQEPHVGHSTGIGLTNVIRRLQLFYQTHDVVDIISNTKEGTTIRLKLPKLDLNRE